MLTWTNFTLLSPLVFQSYLVRIGVKGTPNTSLGSVFRGVLFTPPRKALLEDFGRLGQKNIYLFKTSPNFHCHQRLPNKLYPTKQALRNTASQKQQNPPEFSKLPTHQPTNQPTPFPPNQPKLDAGFSLKKTRSNCKWCSECDLPRF